MAAQPVAALPEGDEWLYEPKFDGSSYLATVTDSRMSSPGAAGVWRSTRLRLPDRPVSGHERSFVVEATVSPYRPFGSDAARSSAGHSASHGSG